MKPQDVVQHMLSAVIIRPECLNLATGRGEGMKVEWWLDPTAEWTHPVWTERVLYAVLFTRDGGE